MAPEAELYDAIGADYTATRREDPRLAAAVQAALGDAASVINVGAGAGAYEPCDRRVVAVEPAARMIAQRARNAAPVIVAHAEALPFADDSFDAAMAVLSDHHWQDRARGLCEMRRVSRSRAVLFTWDQDFREEFWLTRDYLTAFAGLPGGMLLRQIAGHLGATRIEPYAIPHDFCDGFLAAYWRRPHAYLDPRVRAGISVFHRLPAAHVHEALARLAADLQSGRWHERNAALLNEDEHDLGYRILIADYPVLPRPSEPLR
ncbi:MAG TPA: class I SAM-dependent methyltransferase [Solirubrobacteraceae bacterium]|jgi:SAM-dependent methyltransferase|nr:class I SAM-dependent methyltransferase [Solirubrobacteraceae bacterium]